MRTFRNHGNFDAVLKADVSLKRDAKGKPVTRVLPQIEAVLAALIRVGGLIHSSDGSRTFLPRRAA